MHLLNETVFLGIFFWISLILDKHIWDFFSLKIWGKKLWMWLMAWWYPAHPDSPLSQIQLHEWLLPISTQPWLWPTEIASHTSGGLKRTKPGKEFTLSPSRSFLFAATNRKSVFSSSLSLVWCWFSGTHKMSSVKNLEACPTLHRRSLRNYRTVFLVGALVSVGLFSVWTC